MAIREEQALLELGLTENEAKVYLTMLRIGASPVSTIAEHSGLYRPYVYDTLKRLLEKGLASYVKKEGMRYYSAAKPAELKNMLGRKQEILEQVLPSLQTIAESFKQEAEVNVFQGRRIVRIIQKDVLNTLLEKGGESLVFGVDEKKFMEIDEVIMKQFFAAMKRHGLRERVLVGEGEMYLPAARKTTGYRFVPREFFNPQPTFIYGDKVAIILFTEPLYGIIIESKELAESYRRQFNLIWKHAKKRR
jgi:predicted transcriptional regulator